MPDPFVAQLQTLCRDERTAAKWIVVPSRGLGWTLGERLLHEGCNWVNLRFVTPFQLALEAAAPELVARGLNPSPENLGPSLIQGLLLRQPKADYFGPLILQPGMAEALWRALSELRLAGLGPADLKRLKTSPKRRELERLLAAYLAYLDEHGLADRATVLSQPLTNCPVQSHDLVLPFPYTVWSPLEARLIDALPGRHLRPDATDLPAPRRLGSRRPMGGPRPVPRLFHASRREDEIAEVLRRLLKDSVPLDQVEVTAPTEDLPLLADRLAAAGFPATFEGGLPITLSRPGQALTGLLNWVERGMAAYDLRELLRSGLVLARPNSFAAARLLEAARISWGRESYHQRLTELAVYSEERAQRDESRAAWLQAQAEQARELAGWMGALLRKLPAPDPQNRIDFSRWLQGLQDFLATDVSAHGPAEVLARQTLTAALAELKMLGGVRWPLPEALRLLRQRLERLTGNPSRPRPGALHVVPLERLGLSGRSVVFVLGLEEGRLEVATPEDCVLDDQERMRLDPGLALSGDRAQESVFHIRERLATLTGQVTFSYAACDRAGEQEQLPSWWFFEAARGQQPELSSLEELARWLGPPHVAPRPPAPELTQFPDLERGQRAREARQSPEFTHYDGFVPSAAGLWEGRAMSASRLQNLAACPFRFWLEEGLQLSPEALPLPDPDRWLDPATRGTILHEVFAEFHRGLRSRGWRPELSRDRRQLDLLLDQQLKGVRELLPPPSKAVERAEVAALKRDLERFLTLELQNPERTPIAFEVPFGMDDASVEPLAHPAPLWLELGDGLRLSVRGRIDRLDQVPAGYAVVDYKTGRKLPIGRQAVYERGQLLQHALYALVAEQLLRGQGPVVESSYYFPTAGAARDWITFPYPDPTRFRRVLQHVLEPLRSGAFVHSHERDNDCRYCDFQAACGAHSDEWTRQKLNHPSLASRRLLQEEA